MNLQTSQTVRNSADAFYAAGLLRDLIDYAGLFPPASLAMAPSVANYDSYSRSEWNWILGRFIVPVARLGEFEEAFAGLPTPTPGPGFRNWRLSALLGSTNSTVRSTGSPAAAMRAGGWMFRAPRAAE